MYPLSICVGRRSPLGETAAFLSHTRPRDVPLCWLLSVGKYPGLIVSWAAPLAWMLCKELSPPFRVGHQVGESVRHNGIRSLSGRANSDTS